MLATEKTMEKIVALCKGRGFVYAGSEIYGGLSNTWDYGPLGVEFKNNVKRAWWKAFVQESPYNVGLDAAILMNPQVWVASGHVGGFSDPLMDCKACKTRHRADKLIEDQTGEKFDWDAYFKRMRDYNKQLEYERQKWDINKTPYPQMTGAAFWLYRIFYFNLSGGSNEKFLKVDEKVNKIMMKAYEKKTPVSKEMRHRAVVWSCPANYYTSFANWLENCWGMNVVMDMETMISYLEIDTEDKEQSLKDLAKTYQRSIMRKHTKGGYRNVVDELWRIVEEYNADTVIMYDQISCKGMDGLTGIFDDQAREKGINFIWVRQDLMDPRTISRREMREQVNKYMQTVLQEEPVDASLVDFEDDLAW